MSNIRIAMNRGAFDFLTKPIDFGDLEMTIDKTICHVEMPREARRRQLEAERAQASLSRFCECGTRQPDAESDFRGSA
jgi:FixJ family two-component response regulator